VNYDDHTRVRPAQRTKPAEVAVQVQSNEREATADMANYPKKMKDPTESALTAIQEALSTTTEPPASNRSIASSDPMGSYSEPIRRSGRASGSAQDKDLFGGSSTPVLGLEDDHPTAPRAANDDRQSIGQILQTLQRRPAKTSYLVATAFALAWVIGGVILATIYLPDLHAAAAAPAGIPAMVGLGAFLLAPIVFFYLLAHMVWR